MKNKMNFRSLLTVLTAIVSMTLSLSCEKDSIIDATRLPDEAQSFISTYFSTTNVVTVMKEGSGIFAEYDVMLADGTKLSFDRNGEWTDVDCGHSAVPAGIVPEQISTKVAELYPQSLIVGIDRDSEGYEVELDNGIDLSFNKKLTLKEVD